MATEELRATLASCGFSDVRIDTALGGFGRFAARVIA
jgi:hypothetical protein